MGFKMPRRFLISAAMLSFAGFVAAEQSPPGPLDLDEALARQAASDQISGVSVAYDCVVAMHSMRQLGTEVQPVYLIQVSMAGPECEEALLLLARHGSTKDFVFRRWQPEPDVKSLDPVVPGQEPGFDLDADDDPGNN
jgi:hypothetical protein